MKKITLAISVLVVWFAIAGTYYVCIIKGLCDDIPEEPIAAVEELKDSENQDISDKLPSETAEIPESEIEEIIADTLFSYPLEIYYDGELLSNYESNFKVVKNDSVVNFSDDLADFGELIKEKIELSEDFVMTITSYYSTDEDKTVGIGRSNFIKEKLIALDIPEDKIVTESQIAVINFDEENSFEGGIELNFNEAGYNDEDTSEDDYVEDDNYSDEENFEGDEDYSDSDASYTDSGEDDYNEESYSDDENSDVDSSEDNYNDGDYSDEDNSYNEEDSYSDSEEEEPAEEVVSNYGREEEVAVEEVIEETPKPAPVKKKVVQKVKKKVAPVVAKVTKPKKPVIKKPKAVEAPVIEKEAVIKKAIASKTKEEVIPEVKTSLAEIATKEEDNLGSTITEEVKKEGVAVTEVKKEKVVPKVRKERIAPEVIILKSKTITDASFKAGKLKSTDVARNFVSDYKEGQKIHVIGFSNESSSSFDNYKEGLSMAGSVKAYLKKRGISSSSIILNAKKQQKGEAIKKGVILQLR